MTVKSTTSRHLNLNSNISFKKKTAKLSSNSNNNSSTKISKLQSQPLHSPINTANSKCMLLNHTLSLSPTRATLNPLLTVNAVLLTTLWTLLQPTILINPKLLLNTQLTLKISLFWMQLKSMDNNTWVASQLLFPLATWTTSTKMLLHRFHRSPLLLNNKKLSRELSTDLKMTMSWPIKKPTKTNCHWTQISLFNNSNSSHRLCNKLFLSNNRPLSMFLSRLKATTNKLLSLKVHLEWITMLTISTLTIKSTLNKPLMACLNNNKN